GVVEVVGNATCQAPDGVHFLRTPQLNFGVEFLSQRLLELCRSHFDALAQVLIDLFETVTRRLHVVNEFAIVPLQLELLNDASVGVTANQQKHSHKCGEQQSDGVLQPSVLQHETQHWR